MTNKLSVSYMHKVCTGMEKSVFATLLIFYLFLAKWTAVHNLVLFTLTISHIIATRVGLDLLVWPVFLKNSLTSARLDRNRKPRLKSFWHPRYQTTGNKERLGSIWNWQSCSWFQSIGQFSLWYKENPLYLSSEEKIYKRSSNVSDRRPVIVPGWRADLHPARRFVCFMVGL